MLVKTLVKVNITPDSSDSVRSDVSVTTMNSIKFEQDELFPLRFLNKMRVESRTTPNVTIVTNVHAFVAHKKDIYCIACESLNTSAFRLKYLGYTAISVICGTWNKLHNY